MNLVKALVLALSLAAGGCSMTQFQPLGKETLKNGQGHVIGYVERLCDCGRGEELDRVVLFTPRRGERGRIVAYEERVKGGAVLRDLSGKRIGNRWTDLRSRGTNPRNGGLTIVFVPRESERMVIAQSLTIEQVKQHLKITD